MMRSERRRGAWRWIVSLAVTEEIPAAVVTYVALLMFLQFGADYTMAAIYGAALLLPWLLKSVLYIHVLRMRALKGKIAVGELLILTDLMAIALYLTYGTVRVGVLFLLLVGLSLLLAWHELLTRVYYNKVLPPRQQRLYLGVKMLASQMTLVITYGLLIITAGFFEVFFRSYQKAWAMESALVAGVFLVFCAVNLLVLAAPYEASPVFGNHLPQTVKSELKAIVHVRQKPYVGRVLLSLFLLLLPQALLFHTRVFFLMDEVGNGGLSCSVQEVGFAQGTVGVIAFSQGIVLGRLLVRRNGIRQLFGLMAVVLPLSPIVYMLMALHPLPSHLVPLCCMTFVAQLCFGFGLNVCGIYVRYLLAQRYRNVVNFLYVPLVVCVMLVPMAASGWLCEVLGYRLFFVACVLLVPLAWGVLLIFNIQKILIHNEEHTLLPPTGN